MIARLGFYWDDWPSIYYLHEFGPSGFLKVFAEDRPLLGWLFALTTSIVGQSTVAWQVFGLLTRWLCGVSLWGFLRALWPERTRLALWVALLFTAYPTFQQQYIAVTYSHDWLILAGFFFSFTLMIWAVRSTRWKLPLLALSWLLAAYAMFADEYYFGLELLRPLVLWWELAGRPRSARLRLTGLLWLPYLLLMGAFLYWRIVLYESPRGEVQVFDLLLRFPIPTLIDLARTIGVDLFQAGLLGWMQAFNLPDRAVLALVHFNRFAAIAAVTAIAFTAYLFLMNRTSEGGSKKLAWPQTIGILLLGGFSLLIAGAPFWVTYLPIETYFPWDRFTLPMMLGSSLMVFALIELIRIRPLQIVLIGALLGLTAGGHYLNALTYTADWATQKEFFWQLSWRAPAIQPGTTLITSAMPFRYYSDNSLTAPLNWTYAPDSRAPALPYVLINTDSRLGNTLHGLYPGVPISLSYRANEFHGSTSQAIALFYDPRRCVKVLDPQADLYWPRKDGDVPKLVALSNLNLIQTDVENPAAPPAAIFGPEPDPGWCYFFQKAELAVQFGEWQSGKALLPQGLQLSESLTGDHAAELRPFIQILAHLGRWDEAQKWTRKAISLDDKAQTVLCDAWRGLLTLPTADPAAASAVQEHLQCKPPLTQP